ncbi:hypothetical protein [Noviherbaspirillum sedimenti]|uniref:DUF2116 family Zn-ribbon domain-containing protein n=1 Tax=Noviherbaspirillum sedimenti TaxID=2320865 RepID=A0A3A3G5Q9_9BURK|nr:hypothetical protein [Noviherbaspirillum sedimenti]RJG03853.1 hypothetical protein D3878_21535 [Noviherbaspirillum sedimenti]
MNDADSSANETQTSLQALVTAPESGQGALKPKGACWYCNAPLDNIRRFCNKDCAQDYRTEEESFR